MLRQIDFEIVRLPVIAVFAAMGALFLFPASLPGAEFEGRAYVEVRPYWRNTTHSIVVEGLGAVKKHAGEAALFHGKPVPAAVEAHMNPAGGASGSGVRPEETPGKAAGGSPENTSNVELAANTSGSEAGRRTGGASGNAPPNTTSVAASADTPAESGEEWRNRILRVALSGPYEPFLFIDAKGNPSGFDLDIAMSLCEELGSECRFVNERFDAIIPALVAGEYDFAVAGFSVTAQRERFVDFTKRYFLSHSVFIGIPDEGQASEYTPELLAGKRLGTQLGSVQASYLRNNYPGSKLVLAGTFGELMAMLGSGKIDLALVEGLPAYTFLKSQEGRLFETIGDPLSDGALSAPASIAVSKRERGLRESLDRALERIYASGAYERINRKYFDFTIY